MIHCKDCIYFDRFKQGMRDLGYCKIDSPVIVQGMGHTTGKWPTVPETEFCGCAVPFGINVEVKNANNCIEKTA